MLKKSAIFILLVSFLINIIGYYPLFKLQQLSIKESVEKLSENFTPKKDLQLISFSKKDNKINWKEKNKEFVFNNKMFDVIYTETSSDSIHYYCFDDSKETSLFAKLNTFIKKETDTSKDTANKTTKKVSLFNCIIPEKECIALNSNLNSNLNSFNNKAYKSVLIEILAPPPQFI